MDEKRMQLKTDLDHDLRVRSEVVEVVDARINVLRDGVVLTSTDLGEVRQAHVEEGIGIARLVLDLDSGEEREIAYFTKAKIKQFRALANAVSDHLVEEQMTSISTGEKEKRQGSKAGTMLW